MQVSGLFGGSLGRSTAPGMIDTTGVQKALAHTLPAASLGSLLSRAVDWWCGERGGHPTFISPRSPLQLEQLAVRPVLQRAARNTALQ